MRLAARVITSLALAVLGPVTAQEDDAQDWEETEKQAIAVLAERGFATQLADLPMPTIPPRENALRRIYQGAVFQTRNGGGSQLVGPYDLRPGRLRPGWQRYPDSVRRAIAERALADPNQQQWLDQMWRYTDLEGASNWWQASVSDSLLTVTGGFKQSHADVMNRLLFERYLGSMENAYKCVGISYFYGRSLRYQPSVRELHRRTAVIAVSTDSLHALLHEHAPSPKLTQDLVALIRRDRGVPVSSRALRGELALLAGYLGPSLDPIGNRVPEIPMMDWFPYRVIRTTREDGFVDTSTRFSPAVAPYLYALAAAAELAETPWLEQPAEKRDALAAAIAATPDDVAAHLPDVVNEETFQQTLLVLSEAALLLELARQAQGEYPTTLPADATPDPCSGQPLRYERLGEGYRLYSIGLDRVDDGGAGDSLMSWAGPDLVWIQAAPPPAVRPPPRVPPARIEHPNPAWRTRMLALTATAHVPYELPPLPETIADPEANAAVLYHAAFDLLAELSRGRLASIVSIVPDGHQRDWEKVPRRYREAVMERHTDDPDIARYFMLLEEAAALPVISWRTGQAAHRSTTAIGYSRWTAAKWLADAIYFDAHDGDGKRVGQLLRQLIHLAQPGEDASASFDWLSYRHILGTIDAAVYDALCTVDVAPADLQALREMRRRVSIDGQSLRASYQHETAEFLFESIDTDLAMLQLLGDREAAKRELGIQTNLRIDREYADYQAKPETLRRKALTSPRSSDLDFDGDRTYDRALTLQIAMERGVDTALALVLWRQTHGTYPPTLGALVPELLESVPIDPCTGTAIRYTRTAKGFDLAYGISSRPITWRQIDP